MPVSPLSILLWSGGFLVDVILTYSPLHLMAATQAENGGVEHPPEAPRNFRLGS